jgi:hypothetical protein
MAIKLGGGGGSASQINEIVTLSNTADTVTLSDERVYLRGGLVAASSTYPLAATSLRYLGTNFSVGSQMTTPQGLAWDGTHFWVIGDATDAVYKYTAAGVYTGTSFSVYAQERLPQGIVFDGTSFWVIGNYTNRAHKYNASGVYQNVDFSVASQDNAPRDITWDGTHFWVLGDQYNKVYKYNASGVYQNVSFNVGAYDFGITWDGTDFWVANDTTNALDKYNASGVYQSSISIQSEEIYVTGVLAKGGNLYAVGTANDTVFEYAPAVGISAVSNLGGQNYVRVV